VVVGAGYVVVVAALFRRGPNMASCLLWPFKECFGVADFVPCALGERRHAFPFFVSSDVHRWSHGGTPKLWSAGALTNRTPRELFENFNRPVRPIRNGATNNPIPKATKMKIHFHSSVEDVRLVPFTANLILRLGYHRNDKISLACFWGSGSRHGKALVRFDSRRAGSF
jgi:hypothetical protein